MTTVEAVFTYQGKLDLNQTRRLGESYTALGIRRIMVNEDEHTIRIEYDATRMDQFGVAAMLRNLGVAIAEHAGA